MAITECSGTDNACECIGCRIARMVEMEPDEVSPNFILEQLMVVAGSLICMAPEEMHEEVLADCVEVIEDVVAQDRVAITGYQGRSLH